MKSKYKAVYSILGLCILGVSVFVSLKLIRPVEVKPSEAPAMEFSAERALQDLDIIAREPHPIGVSDARAEVRDYLLEEIRAAGLEAQVQESFGIRVVRPGFVLGGPVENVLARLPGTDPEGAIVLMSHYDSTPGAPGGVDSGSGVVTVLELLRALQAGPRLRQDVIGLLTDGEEPGTIGAHAFAAHHPWFKDVRMVMNMDQFREGPANLIRNNLGNGPWIQALARSDAANPAYISLPYHLFAGGETDLVPFMQAGLAGADIMTTAPYPENHTLLDLPELVDAASLQQAGEQLLAMVRYLANQPSLNASIPEQTYFPVLGKLVHYPSSWAPPLALTASLCFVGMIAYGLRKRQITWRGMGIGLLVLVLSLVLSVGITNLLWLGIQSLHPEYAYSQFRPHLSDDYLYAIGLILVPVVISSCLIAIARKSTSAMDLAAGTLVLWLPISIAATLIVPMTSYLASWGLMSGSLALWFALAIQARKGAWLSSGLAFLLSGILMIFLWLPVITIIFLGATLQQVSLLVGVTALWTGSMIPILDWITDWRRWLLPVSSSLLAIGFLVAGHTLVGRDSPAPLVNPVGYWLDAESQEAFWLAFTGGKRLDAQTTERKWIPMPEDLDHRQTNLLTNPVQRDYTELFPEAPPYAVQTSPAPLLALEGARLEILEDIWEEEGRLVKLKVTSSMHSRIYIIVPEETPPLAIKVPENAWTALPPVEKLAWMLRFDGMPVEGIEISLEFAEKGPIRFYVVEERTGLPSFPGLVTQPEAGRMVSPAEFTQCLPSDFTAIYREYVFAEVSQ